MIPSRGGGRRRLRALVPVRGVIAAGRSATLARLGDGERAGDPLYGLENTLALKSHGSGFWNRCSAHLDAKILQGSLNLLEAAGELLHLSGKPAKISRFCR